MVLEGVTTEGQADLAGAVEDQVRAVAEDQEVTTVELQGQVAARMTDRITTRMTTTGRI